MWEATGTEEGEYLTDSDGTIAPGSTRPYVDAIFDEDSALTRVIGKAKLGDAIAKAAQEYAREHLGATEETPKAPAPSVSVADEGFIDNVQGRMETLQKNIDRQVKSKAARQLGQVYGGHFPKDQLGPEIQRTWTLLYQEAGIPWRPGVRPGNRLKTLDEDQLRRLLHVLNEEA
jgi:hypothetical protein